MISKIVYFNSNDPSYLRGLWHAVIGLKCCEGNACGASWSQYRRGHITYRWERRKEKRNVK